MDKRRIAVVTGASGGFGREFVRIFSADNNIEEIWAVSRAGDRLERLRAEFGEKVLPVVMDLTDRNSFSVLEKMLSARNVTVSVLVNNAGFAKFCSFRDISAGESLNMIDLNVSAVVAVGLVCIPFMAAGSRIMNVASQASFFPLPYMNIYSATKAFVRNYTRALNVELGDRKITATAVCPGWMRTGLFARGEIGAAKTVTRFAGLRNPSSVAEKAVRDAFRGRDISVCGAFTKFTHVLSKILPQRLMMRLWLAQQGLL